MTQKTVFKEGKRAAIYVRVSSNEQAQNGWGLEGQYDDSRDYCDKQGYTVVRVFRDDGYSGANLERPGIKKLIELAHYDLFDIVVLWKYDRISRDRVDFPILLYYLHNNDIKVESVREPSGDGPYNDFVVGILGLFSDLERRMLKIRTMMGIKTRVKNGYFWGGPAYGYIYNPKTGHLEINKKEASIVRLIFEKYLELNSTTRMADYLNSQDIPSQKGRGWKAATIYLLLKNETYLGYYKFNDQRIPRPEIQIISTDLFEKFKRE